MAHKVGNGMLMSAIMDALKSDAGALQGLRTLSNQLAQTMQASYRRYYQEEIFGTSPKTADQALERVDNPVDMIVQLLISDEFIDAYPKIFLSHFGNLERELFIHVQKMGGTTLLNSFRSSPYVAQILLPDFVKGGWVEDRLLFLRNTLLQMSEPSVRSVIVAGHLSSSYIIRNKLKRGLDRVFMTVRDPVSTSISYVNFVLMILSDKQDNPGIRFWRSELGMTEKEWPSDDVEIRSLASKIVEVLLPTNSMCSMLGTEPNCASAVECAGILDCKFIDTARIDAYCNERGLPAAIRANESLPFVEINALDERSRAVLHDKIGEDLKLFEFCKRSM